MAGDRLSRVAGGPADHGVLDPRRAQRRDPADRDARQLSPDCGGAGLPRRRAANDPDRAARPAWTGIRDRRRLARHELPLVALHGDPGLRRARADPRLAPQCVRGPAGETRLHLPQGDPPPRLPGRGRRLDLHLLADARRLHRAEPRRVGGPVHRDRRVLDDHHEPPARGGVRNRADRRDGPLPAPGPPAGSLRARMTLSRGARRWLMAGAGVTLAFLYIPLFIIGIQAFSTATTLEWPPPGLTFEWFGDAVDNPGARNAFENSLKAGTAATLIALVLGTLAALAVSRHRFFGRETISFLVILPIALPGIVTGLALNSTFTQILGIDLSLFTIVVGHATFCIVVVYNNVVARLRRLSTSFEEASADLGASTWQTFRLVTLPNMRTALVAGALLAFALSFDEIIVTTFTAGVGEQTLPIWIFSNLSRPNQLPIVNVVALLVILISIIPVYFAHRLTRDEGGAGGRGGAAPVQPEAATAP